MYMAFDRQGHLCQGIKSIVAGIKRIHSISSISRIVSAFFKCQE